MMNGPSVGCFAAAWVFQGRWPTLDGKQLQGPARKKCDRQAFNVLRTSASHVAASSLSTLGDFAIGFPCRELPVRSPAPMPLDLGADAGFAHPTDNLGIGSVRLDGDDS